MYDAVEPADSARRRRSARRISRRGAICRQRLRDGIGAVAVDQPDLRRACAMRPRAAPPSRAAAAAARSRTRLRDDANGAPRRARDRRACSPRMCSRAACRRSSGSSRWPAAARGSAVRGHCDFPSAAASQARIAFRCASAATPIAACGPSFARRPAAAGERWGRTCSYERVADVTRTALRRLPPHSDAARQPDRCRSTAWIRMLLVVDTLNTLPGRRRDTIWILRSRGLHDAVARFAVRRIDARTSHSARTSSQTPALRTDFARRTSHRPHFSSFTYSRTSSPHPR